MSNRAVHFIEKVISQAGSLFVIPKDGIIEFLLS
jgi:hypothetical protein